MAFGRTMKLGVGVGAAALLSIATIGFAPTQSTLPTVTVYHSPT
jgi:hypothetical protein